jgi:predicted site-specific integrase-resolvase
MEQTAPHLLNEKQTAQALSVSVGALRKWRREYRGPVYIRCERCIRYDVREIERFLQRNSSKRKAADLESAARRGVRHAYATAPR